MIAALIILVVLALLALRAALRHPIAPEAAIVRQMPSGNWTVILPDERTVGEFATSEDAARLARMNGFEPVGGEEAAR